MMQLDLPTLMAMGSFVTASAGAVLLFAWLQNRNASPMQADRCPAVPCAEAGLVKEVAASIKLMPTIIAN